MESAGLSGSRYLRGECVGKSTVLDALRYALAVVEFSAGEWQQYDTVPHVPFALDEVHPGKPSCYEFDFVVGETRYQYGFELGGGRH